jgi:hypothetical protein
MEKSDDTAKPEMNAAPPQGMDPEQEADPGSLADWIKRAKRAHELVDAVNLDKITEHDQTEVAKLSTVSNALDDLADGKDVEHVEGVDEVLPELDPEQQRKTVLFATLADAGLAVRMGRLLFVDQGAVQLKPLELIPHNEGLPEFDVCVAPENAAQSGNFGLFVSPQGVFAASISEPPTTHHWRVVRSSPYDNHEELVQTLRQFSTSVFD